MKKAIPEFTTDDDAEHFVDTADLTEYDLSGFAPAQFEFQAKTAQLNMRLPQTLLYAVKESAKKRGIPYTRFVREILEGAVKSQARSKSFTIKELSIGNLQVIVESTSIVVSGRSVSLTVKERTIIELLLMQKNRIVSKEEILNYLYEGYDEPELRIVDVFIAQIRKKLADAGARDVIATVWGRGYLIRDGAPHRPKDEASDQPVEGEPRLEGSAARRAS